MTEEWRKINDWEIELEQRISELEASSASHTEFIKNHVENHMDWDGHQNEKIAELENRLSGSEKIISDSISELENKMKRVEPYIDGEIAELTEKLDNVLDKINEVRDGYNGFYV